MIYYYRVLFAFILLTSLQTVRGAGSVDSSRTGYMDPDTAKTRLRIGNYNPALLGKDGDYGWIKPSEITLDSIIPGKDIWFRMPLPDIRWKNPALYVYGFLFNLEIYIDSSRIYDYRGQKPGREGPRWIIIPLNHEYAGRNLFIKAYIKHLLFLGELREVKIGSTAELLQLRDEQEFTMTRDFARDAIVGGILLFLALFSLFIFALRFSLRLYPFLLFSIIAMCSGIDYILYPAAAGGLLGLQYGYLELISLIALFILSPVFIMFIEQLFGPGIKKLLRRLWQISIVYTAVFLAAIAVDVRYAQYFPDVAQTILVEIGIIVIIFIISGYLKKPNAKYIIAAIGIFLVLAVFDLVSEAVNPAWQFTLSGWGVLILAFALSHMLITYYTRMAEDFTITRAAMQKKEAEVKLLREENLRSQYEALKSQVNPHFLFNSFSTLISLIEEKPEMAQRFVQMLSNVYRYVLFCQDKELVLLSSEIEFVQAYMFLLKNRFENAIDVAVSIPEKYYSYSIVPLSLQILLENVIKHNIVSEKKPMKIQISYHEDTGYLTVSNTLQRKNTFQESTKLGLKNIINRYKFFSDKEIIIENGPCLFAVYLPLIEGHYGNTGTDN
ncbi:MAG: histidine kinase [Ignavibacteriales bacterium]|nr:histidine kinase [Ignavibacteriales bacterium]